MSTPDSSSATSDTVPRPLRHNREYLAWLTGDLCQDAGTGIGVFAYPLITLAVTGSAGMSGLVGLVGGVGLVLGMLPGGLLADRHDRRRLRLLAGVIGILLQAVLVAALVGGWASVTVLAGLSFLTNLRGTLLGSSASNAMLKQIVPPAQLPRAFAVNEGREAAVSMGAGPAGGALLGVGLAFPALAQLLGFAGSVLATLAMRGQYRPRALDAEPTRVLADLREALQWCLSQRIRLQLAGVALALNLAGNGMLMTVVLNLALRGVPAARIGLLETVLAGSILVGALVAPRLLERVPTGTIILSVVASLAVAAAVVPALDSLVAIGAVYAVMGLGLAPLNAGTQGFFMHITPSQMQGRVGSFMGIGAMALAPLAPGIAGFGLEHLGTGATFAIFAGVGVLGLLICLCGRQLRRIPVASDWVGYAEREGLAQVPNAQTAQETQNAQ